MIVLITPLVVALTSLAAPQPSPASLDAFSKRGTAAREANRLEDAADIYREAVRLHPRWTEGHWYLGTISYELGNAAACRSELQKVVQVQTRNGAAWAFKGLCEFQLKTYAVALHDLTLAQKLGVGDDAELPAVVGYHRAILLTRAGRFEAAVDEIAGFVRGGNTGPTIVEALGLAMLRVPQVPAEATPQTRAMALLAGQGAIYAYRRMPAAAEQSYTQLLTQYPDVPNVHYVYGAYLVHERPDEALEQFKLELKVSPAHVLARVQIAQELVKRGQFGEAAPFASEAVARDGNNFVARRVLGQVKFRSGDVAGAITQLEAARALEPSSPSVHFHLARAYQRAGRDEDAKRERLEFSRLEALQQKQRGADLGGAEPPEP